MRRDDDRDRGVTENAAPGVVLVVDDEPGIREFAAQALESAGHRVLTAADGAEALQWLGERPFDVVLLDLTMPGAFGGMEVLRRARASHPEVQVVVVTARGSVGDAVEAMKLGAFDFLQKPLAGPEALRGLVRRALNWRGRPATAAPTTPSPPADSAAAPVAPVPPGGWARLHAELRRRRVYRVAVAYCAGVFALLQGGEVILEAFRTPAWALPALVAASAAGFPLALLLGWIYDVQWPRLERTRRAGAGSSPTPATSARTS